MLVRFKVASCQITSCWSSVERTSNSKPSQPCSSASSKASKVFSGAYLRAPRCPRSSGLRASELVEVNIAYARRVWRLFGALHGFLKLFFQQVGLVLLRFHRLPEQRLLAALLLLHGAGSFIKVVEGLHPRRRGVGDDGVRGGINLQHRP